MKVHELLDLLQEMDPDQDVVVEGPDHSFYSAGLREDFAIRDGRIFYQDDPHAENVVTIAVIS